MIEYLEWDSDFFGISVGSVRNRVDSESHLDSVLRELKESNLNLIYLTVPVDRADLITGILREREAILADTRVEMSADIAKLNSRQELDEPDGFLIRMAEDKDAVPAGELASYCFRGLTRFYRDPRLSDERCDELYRTWAERDIGRESNSCLICTFKERTAGFSTAVCTGDKNAKIGLIGVDTEFRGCGVGQALLKNTAGMLWEKGIEHLIAVTQLASIGAMRMYERAGFLLRETSVVLHLWKDVEGI